MFEVITRSAANETVVPHVAFRSPLYKQIYDARIKTTLRRSYSFGHIITIIPNVINEKKTRRNAIIKKLVSSNLKLPMTTSGHIMNIYRHCVH